MIWAMQRVESLRRMMGKVEKGIGNVDESGPVVRGAAQRGRSKAHTSSGRAARGKHRQIVAHGLKKVAWDWRLGGVESKK